MKALTRWLLAVVLGAAPVALPAAGPVLVSGGSIMDGNRFKEEVRAPIRNHFAGARAIVLVLDATHPEDRERMEARLHAAFRDLGDFEAVSDHRLDVAGRLALLEQAEGIFVGGGETFALLRALREDGRLEAIRRRVAAGVPYAGSSAGANIAGTVIGTTNDFPVTDVPTRAALGLVAAIINPHHPHREDPAHAGRAAKIGGYLRFNPGEQVVGLGDASLLLVRDGTASVVRGPAWLYTAAGSRPLAEGEPVPALAPKE